MSYNRNPLANKQVLDLLAELQRPASPAEIADRLCLGINVVYARLGRLRAAGQVISEPGGGHGRRLWHLAGAAQTGSAFTRRNLDAALPALERVVSGWLRIGRVEGGLNGE